MENHNTTMISIQSHPELVPVRERKKGLEMTKKGTFYFLFLYRSKPL